MDTLEESRWSGKFTLGQDRDVDGELMLLGPRTSLHLHDKDEFSTLAIPNQYIRGIRHDLTRLSLIQCVPTSGTGSSIRGNDKYHFASLFPHFVVYGDIHLAPNERTITGVRFALDDASTLFYDFDAFGLLMNARPFIKPILEANSKFAKRKIGTGPEPWILYFAGKKEIIATDTVLGRVSASHNPRPTSFGGPGGVGLKNTVFVNIEFTKPVDFQESIFRTSTLIKYLELLVGRPQNLMEFELGLKSGHGGTTRLHVYWSLRPKRGPSREGEKPQPCDVLLDAVRQPDDFSRVLTNWLDRDKSWRDARSRFYTCFAKQDYYDIDRLIGAANMFDILPPSAMPANEPLTPEVETAKKITQEVFARLPVSLERNSVLSALGRIGKASLKQKVRQRARMVVDALGKRMEELPMVTDEAVNCRNFYVHGTKQRFDYNDHFDSVIFLIDALEFVFAASDLIEAGWDAKAWRKRYTSMSHPFARFRVNYSDNLTELKALLSGAPHPNDRVTGRQGPK